MPIIVISKLLWMGEGVGESKSSMVQTNTTNLTKCSIIQCLPLRGNKMSEIRGTLLKQQLILSWEGKLIHVPDI